MRPSSRRKSTSANGGRRWELRAADHRLNRPDRAGRPVPARAHRWLDRARRRGGLCLRGVPHRREDHGAQGAPAAIPRQQLHGPAKSFFYRRTAFLQPQQTKRRPYGLWMDREGGVPAESNPAPAGTVRTRSDGTTFTTKAVLYEIENRRLHSPRTLAALKADLARLGQQSRLAA
jgi:hypothetical protein